MCKFKERVADIRKRMRKEEASSIEQLEGYISTIAEALSRQHDLEEDCSESLVLEMAAFATREEGFPCLVEALEDEELAAEWLEVATEAKFMERVIDSLLEDLDQEVE